MPNSLFVSYDLRKDVEKKNMDETSADYKKVSDAIKDLGEATRIHYSYWFVASNYNAKDSADRIWNSMDANDTLFVIDASNGQIVEKKVPADRIKRMKGHIDPSITLVP